MSLKHVDDPAAVAWSLENPQALPNHNIRNRGLFTYKKDPIRVELSADAFDYHAERSPVREWALDMWVMTGDLLYLWGG